MSGRQGKHDQLRVAILQLNSVDSVEKNFQQILAKAAKIQDPVDLICLPENALYLRLDSTSTLPRMTAQSVDFSSLQRLADEKDAGVMVGSVPWEQDGHLYNSTLFFRPGGRGPEPLYHKMHLFDVDVPGAPAVRESDSFKHGGEPFILNWRGWKIGLAICYDVRFGELFIHYAKQGVDLILVPSSFLVPTGKVHWHTLLKARAIETQAYVVAAAQAGQHISTLNPATVRETYGHSLVVDPWGQVLVDLELKQDVSTIVLEKSMIDKVRGQIPMAGHRRFR